MSAWSVDLIGDLVHLVRPSSKEGDTVAVLGKQSTVQDFKWESEIKSDLQVLLTQLLLPFQIHFPNLQEGR